MSTLLLDRAGLEVRSDGQALALYENGERRGTVPLKLLERCIIQGGQTRLDSGVLLKLAEAGVCTVLFSPRAGRRVATLLGPAHNDAAVRLAQAERVRDAAVCLQWARRQVRAKLRGQQRALRHWLEARPDARKPLTDALGGVAAALGRLAESGAVAAADVGEAASTPATGASAVPMTALAAGAPVCSPVSADPSALPPADLPAAACADRGAGGFSTLPVVAGLQSSALQALAALRGLEGAAARAHFGGLAAVLPPALGFAGRNRRPPRDPANVCLSLGYSLLHVEAVQACHIAGLDPLLGFYHRPAFGRESLACDLVEPLRARVDLWVWELLRERHLREAHFSFDQGACLLGKAGRATFYATWAQQVPPLRRALRRSAALLARALREQGSAWVEHDPDDGEMLDA